MKKNSSKHTLNKSSNSKLYSSHELFEYEQKSKVNINSTQNSWERQKILGWNMNRTCHKLLFVSSSKKVMDHLTLK